MPINVSVTNPVPLGAISVPVNGDPMDAEHDMTALVQKILNMMAGSVQTATPTGTVSPFAGVAAPDGWLLCDGRPVSRVTYSALFGVLGTRYGAGDAVTTFNLPDLRGRAPIGAGQGASLSNRALGATGGSETHLLSIQELPAHDHQAPTAVNQTAGAYEVPAPAGQGGGYAAYDYGNAAKTSITGGNLAHNNMPPFAVLNYIVKV